MNCERAKRYLMLKDSGELSVRRTADLEQHLVVCPDCRTYHEGVQNLTRFAKNALTTDGPSDAAMSRITMAARARNSARTPAVPRGPILRPVWQVAAYAAMILLILGGVHLYLGPGDNKALPGSGVEEISAIVALMIEDAASSEGLVTEESVANDHQKLAVQLLRLEGLSPDHEDLDAEAELILSEEEPLSSKSNARSSTAA